MSNTWRRATKEELRAYGKSPRKFDRTDESLYSQRGTRSNERNALKNLSAVFEDDEDDDFFYPWAEPTED